VLQVSDVNATFAAYSWMDYCLIGLIAVSALIGLSRGLIREVFSLAIWGTALWVGLHYNQVFAAHLERAIPLDSARMAVSFLVIFIGILLLGGMLAFLVGKLVDTTGLGGTDRLAGLLFGVARGVLMVAVLVLVAGVTPLPAEPWWKQSKLIPPFQSLALWLRTQIPSGLAAQVKFPEITLKR
jgi:membrane protein required for colicin V production